jgi:hypothetical protein
LLSLAWTSPCSTRNLPTPFGTPRREYLAKWTTSPSNTLFPRAVVSRVWANFFGRGLVNPADDLRFSNPASNEPLFQEMTAEFVKGGFDVKALIRTIMLSAAYQRSSMTTPANVKDDRFYSHYLIRRLPAEVILDAFSRKVLGWELDRTLTARLPITALEKAIADRKPPPGVVHHSDRGVQYASGAYVGLLRKHGMIPSMSRPANPYDNASCESFMKTLKREEIYANEYHDLDHLRENVAAFIDSYYNRVRLHSALGYKPPEEFEQAAAPAAAAQGATMSFFRHGEIYRPDGHKGKEPPVDGSAAHRSDESPAGYSSASCSPAELASASSVESYSEQEDVDQQ